jgi:hypothetical protein
MLHICGVSKTFGEWYQKTNETEDINKLTLLAFKIIAILHNTRLATFINFWKLSAKASLVIDRRTAVTRSWILRFAHTVMYVFCVDLRTNSDYFPIQH